MNRRAAEHPDDWEEREERPFDLVDEQEALFERRIQEQGR